MLDDIMKTIVNEKLSEINTTMRCEVLSLLPLTIKPVQEKQYITGGAEYPAVSNVNKIKQWALVEGSPVAFQMPLSVGNIVLVAFGKKDLTDAVILGVIE